MGASEGLFRAKLPTPETGLGWEHTLWCQLLSHAEDAPPDFRWEQASPVLPVSEATHIFSSLFFLFSRPVAPGCWEMCLGHLANSYASLKAHLHKNRPDANPHHLHWPLSEMILQFSLLCSCAKPASSPWGE